MNFPIISIPGIFIWIDEEMSKFDLSTSNTRTWSKKHGCLILTNADMQYAWWMIDDRCKWWQIGLILIGWGVSVTDKWIDRQTDICDCRVAFVTEKFRNILPWSLQSARPGVEFWWQIITSMSYCIDSAVAEAGDGRKEFR